MKTAALQTIDGETLMSRPFQAIPFIIDTLLAQGLHILAGAPKVGKSWLALWLSVSVAKGEPVWGMDVRRGAVLYLCLEDSLGRIQNRLFQIADDAPPTVHFATEASPIRGGLPEQLDQFVQEHPDTALIIIDTLQLIRGAGYEHNYSNDYKDLSELKKLADRAGLAILLIHHLRKEDAPDPFNRISGTTGIQGAADSSFTLVEAERGSRTALLTCIGRDIDYRELKLFRNDDNVWELKGDSLQEEGRADSIVPLIQTLLREREHFTGTPSELSALLSAMGDDMVSERTVGRRLAQNQWQLETAGISFSARRSNGTRLIQLARRSDDGVDKDGSPSPRKYSDPVDPVGRGGVKQHEFDHR